MISIKTDAKSIATTALIGAGAVWLAQIMFRRQLAQAGEIVARGVDAGKRAGAQALDALKPNKQLLDEPAVDDTFDGLFLATQERENREFQSTSSWWERITGADDPKQTGSDWHHI